MDFISSRVDCKLPKLYFTETVNGKGIFAMELIDGVTPNSKTLFFRKNKSKLANEIVDNLIKFIRFIMINTVRLAMRFTLLGMIITVNLQRK